MDKKYGLYSLPLPDECDVLPLLRQNSKHKPQVCAAYRVDTLQKMKVFCILTSRLYRYS